MLKAHLLTYRVLACANLANILTFYVSSVSCQSNVHHLHHLSVSTGRLIHGMHEASRSDAVSPSQSSRVRCLQPQAGPYTFDVSVTMPTRISRSISTTIISRSMINVQKTAEVDRVRRCRVTLEDITPSNAVLTSRISLPVFRTYVGNDGLSQSGGVPYTCSSVRDNINRT